jgi:antirestriction protein ArdC
MTKTKKNKKGAFEIVTDSLVKRIEEEKVLPWKSGWAAAKDGSPRALSGSLPRSVATGRIYEGINLINLYSRGFASPWWITKGEIIKRGGTWKGKGQQVICFTVKWYDADGNQVPEKDPKAIKKRIACFYHYVWNLEQTSDVDTKGLELPQLPESLADEPQESIALTLGEAALGCEPNPCDEVFFSMNERGTPCYIPSRDEIQMPLVSQFESHEHFMSVRFHERIHATGHAKRLDRDGIKGGRFGDQTYSYEELIAEMGACFLSIVTGCWSPDIETNSASYLAGWLKALKADPSMLYKAAKEAQQAVEYILQSPLDKWKPQV